MRRDFPEAIPECEEAPRSPRKGLLILREFGHVYEVLTGLGGFRVPKHADVDRQLLVEYFDKEDCFIK